MLQAAQPAARIAESPHEKEYVSRQGEKISGNRGNFLPFTV